MMNWRSFFLFIIVMLAASFLMKISGVPDLIRIILVISLSFVWPPMRGP